MTVVAFIGPSMSVADAEAACPGVEIRPPASRGDVMRASTTASVIALVDGYYEHLPSVWHKELLHALEAGCHVVGGGSMGAIRAAELAPFGMVGVGRIHERFADGTYGDADVSVAHGPAPDYRASSVPFANVHCTLEAAEGLGVISRSTALALLEAAQSLFYADRTYPQVVARARSTAVADDVAVADLDRFSAWWPANAIDQKRIDAIEVLRHAAELDGVPAPRRDFTVAQTHFFHEMMREEATLGHTRVADRHAQPIAEEVRLFPDLVAAARSATIIDALADEVARSQGIELSQHLVDAASDSIRRRLGLGDVDALEAWMVDNELDWDGYAALVRRRARIEWAIDHVGGAASDGDAMLDWLRLTGRHRSVVERSRAKSEALRAAGLDETGATDHLASNQEALDWWRLTCAPGLGTVDPLAATGFDSLEALARAARRERAYREIAEPSS